MNSPSCGLLIASIGTGLIGLAHLVRVFLGFQILIGSHPVPMWMSGAAFVVMGLVSFWFWKLSVTAKPVEPSKPAAV
jgi:hypothetical protein